MLRYSLLIKPRLAEIWRWNADKYGEAHATGLNSKGGEFKRANSI